MKNLKLHVIEFGKHDIIKPKIYPSNFIFEDNNYQLIIIFTNAEYTFSANNNI